MVGALSGRISRLRVCAGAAIAALGLLGGCRKGEAQKEQQEPAASAPLSASFPASTRLALGDPQVQLALKLMGASEKIPFVALFQNISGGPHTLEAFRARALDGGAVGDTPPIHAGFTGVDAKIVHVQFRDKPNTELAFAPGVPSTSIADLRGKRLAYAPGQAQGALILRSLKKAGIPLKEVTLVELTSMEFKDALASKQVDVAPLSGPTLYRYLREHRGAGASSILPGVRDNLSFFYVHGEVVKDPNRAAALNEYVKLRTRAQLWARDHAETWIEAYYVRNQGLSPEDARLLYERTGRPVFPASWDEAIQLTQETIDLLAQASGRPPFDARSLFDLRFEATAAEEAKRYASEKAAQEEASR